MTGIPILRRLTAYASASLAIAGVVGAPMPTCAKARNKVPSTALLASPAEPAPPGSDPRCRELGSSARGRPAPMWLEDGSALVAPGRWLYDVKTNRLHELPEPLLGPDDERWSLWSAHRQVAVFFAPHALRLWHWPSERVQTVAYQPVMTFVQTHTPVPELGTHFSSFWYDDDILYVGRFNFRADAEPLCSLFDFSTLSWVPDPVPCVLGTSSGAVFRIHRGPGQRLAVQETVEGHGWFSFVDYDRDVGEFRLPNSARYPIGPAPVDVGFDQTHAYLMSGRPLAQSLPPSQVWDPAADGQYRLYRWDFAGSLELLDEFSADFAAWHPKTGMLAKITGDVLCLQPWPG